MTKTTIAPVIYYLCILCNLQVQCIRIHDSLVDWYDLVHTLVHANHMQSLVGFLHLALWQVDHTSVTARLLMNH